jgi:hypothetical protein
LVWILSVSFDFNLVTFNLKATILKNRFSKTNYKIWVLKNRSILFETTRIKNNNKSKWTSGKINSISCHITNEQYSNFHMDESVAIVCTHSPVVKSHILRFWLNEPVISCLLEINLIQLTSGVWRVCSTRMHFPSFVKSQIRIVWSDEQLTNKSDMVFVCTNMSK